jgi:hypothetical protein
VSYGLLDADALEQRVGTEAAGQLADAIDRLVAAFADDVGGAELVPERNALGVVAEQDDLLGAESLCGDHAAKANGAVADDRNRAAGRDPGRNGSVVAGPNHVGECQQRGYERVVLADGQNDERAVCLRDANGFALAAFEVVEAVAAPVQACALQPLAQTQVPSDHRNGETTRSPVLIVRTSAPTASTMPMNSWPMRRPDSVGSIDL